MIISTYAKKAFDKINHTFIFKTLRKLGREGNFLKLVKNIYKNPTTGDFPGGPVVKTQHSQCRGPGFNPWSGN